jgi:dTDP-L-rhamnose 4-epimerase
VTRILVTGGAGFIGGAVVQAARDAGAEVRVLDSLRSDVHGGAPAAVDGVEYHQGDIRDPEAIANALEGVDVVCHLAAKVGLGVDFADAPDYVDSNVTGTARVLAAMRQQSITRLVFASSMVVYGEGAYRRPGSDHTVRPAARTKRDLDAGVFDPRDVETGTVLEPVLVDESDATDPRNVYATTKLAGEQLATQWARECGGQAALLRFHNVYGPGMPRNTPYAGVAALFRSALERGEAPRVFEDGAQRRDFVHVSDVAAAVLAASDWTGSQPAASARAFNIGSGTVTTVGDLAGALARALDAPAPVITGEYRIGDVRHITASSARARAELDWRPQVPFAAGVQEFATAPLRE